MATVPMGEFVPPASWNMTMGIWVGGCIARKRGKTTGKLALNAKGHAHCYDSDKFRGWSCISDPSNVMNDDGSPSNTVLHEYAHQKTPNQSHTLAWARTAESFGLPEYVLRVSREWRNEKTRLARDAKKAADRAAKAAAGRTRQTVQRDQLPAGTTLIGRYKGRRYVATVLASGAILFEGQEYTSLSAAAQKGVGYQVNGHVFWKVA